MLTWDLSMSSVGEKEQPLWHCRKICWIFQTRKRLKPGPASTVISVKASIWLYSNDDALGHHPGPSGPDSADPARPNERDTQFHRNLGGDEFVAGNKSAQNGRHQSVILAYGVSALITTLESDLDLLLKLKHERVRESALSEWPCCLTRRQSPSHPSRGKTKRSNFLGLTLPSWPPRSGSTWTEMYSMVCAKPVGQHQPTWHNP
jgi:hypothetical protein